MLNLFKAMFFVRPIADGFCLREPSTQVFAQAYKKLKLITDASGDYPTALYRTIYVLACIHKYDNETCGEAVASYFYRLFKGDESLPIFSVEHLFNDVPDEEFVKFIELVASEIPLHKMTEWFNIINHELIITESKKEEAKND